MSAGEPADPATVIGQIADVLNRHGIRDFALTGGVAVGVWATPRQTQDLDVCADIPASAVNALLARFDGVRAGTGDVPDLIRLRIGTWDVDIFVASDEYDRTCLQRAVLADVAGTSARVVTAEDLLIHKLVKLRSDTRRVLQDAADIRAIVAARGDGLDHAYLQRWLPAAQAALIAEISGLTDAELVQRLSALA